MPKFRAVVKGVNFHIESHDSAKIGPMGFYVTAFVDADSPEAARSKALDLVRQSRIYDAARNPPDSPPRILAEEIGEISEWPTDTLRPLTGFALYDEEGDPDFAA